MKNHKWLKNSKPIFCVILAIGMILLFYSLTIPKYTDENKYTALIEMYCQETITKDAYYQELSQITTYRIFIMDIANGIVSFSLFGILLLHILRVNEWKDCKKIKTQNKFITFVLSNVAWILLIPSTFFYYYFRAVRGDYPPFADTISIPIIQQIVFILFMLAPLNLFLLVSLHKSELPTRLLMRPLFYKRPIILWEVFFHIFLLLDIMFLILFIVDGDHMSIIISMSFIYIILSLRAGKLNYLNKLYCFLVYVLHVTVQNQRCLDI